MTAAFCSIVSALSQRPAWCHHIHRLVTMMALISTFLGTGAARTDAQEVIEYYGTDAIGSIRVVFDAAGNVKARSDYLPFGEGWAPATPGGPLPSQRFTGQQRDAEEGHDNFNARSYQTRLGRFTTVDPASGTLFKPQSWNRYAYVRNRPLYFTDPTGMYVHVGTNPEAEMPYMEGSWCSGNCFGPPVPASGPSYGRGRAPAPRAPNNPGGEEDPGDEDPGDPGDPNPGDPDPGKSNPGNPDDPEPEPEPDGDPNSCANQKRVMGNVGWIELQTVPFGAGHAYRGVSSDGYLQWGASMNNPQENNGVWWAWEYKNDAVFNRKREKSGVLHGSQSPKEFPSGTTYTISVVHIYNRVDQTPIGPIAGPAFAWGRISCTMP